MADTPKKPLSKDLAEALLIAMLDNPDQAEAIAALSDEDLARIDESVPEDDDGAGAAGNEGAEGP